MQGCGFEYTPDKGDPEFPVAKGINFQDVPEDYTCPICGSPKTNFESKLKVGILVYHIWAGDRKGVGRVAAWLFTG